MQLQKGEQIKSTMITALIGNGSTEYGNKFVTTILTNYGRVLQKMNDAGFWTDITPSRES